MEMDIDDQVEQLDEARKEYLQPIISYLFTYHNDFPFSNCKLKEDVSELEICYIIEQLINKFLQPQDPSKTLVQEFEEKGQDARFWVDRGQAFQRVRIFLKSSFLQKDYYKYAAKIVHNLIEDLTTEIIQKNCFSEVNTNLTEDDLKLLTLLEMSSPTTEPYTKLLSCNIHPVIKARILHYSEDEDWKPIYAKESNIFKLSYFVISDDIDSIDDYEVDVREEIFSIACSVLCHYQDYHVYVVRDALTVFAAFLETVSEISEIVESYGHEEEIVKILCDEFDTETKLHKLVKELHYPLQPAFIESYLCEQLTHKFENIKDPERLFEELKEINTNFRKLKLTCTKIMPELLPYAQHIPKLLSLDYVTQYLVCSSVTIDQTGYGQVLDMCRTILTAPRLGTATLLCVFCLLTYLRRINREHPSWNLVLQATTDVWQEISHLQFHRFLDLSHLTRLIAENPITKEELYLEEYVPLIDATLESPLPLRLSRPESLKDICMRAVRAKENWTSAPLPQELLEQLKISEKKDETIRNDIHKGMIHCVMHCHVSITSAIALRKISQMALYHVNKVLAGSPDSVKILELLLNADRIYTNELVEEMMQSLLTIIQAPLSVKSFEGIIQSALWAIRQLTFENSDEKVAKEKREILHCILEGIGNHNPNATIVDNYLETIVALNLEELCLDKEVFTTLCSIITARMATKPKGPAVDAMLECWQSPVAMLRKADNTLWQILYSVLSKEKNHDSVLPLLIDKESGCLYRYYLDLLNTWSHMEEPEDFHGMGLNYVPLQNFVRKVATLCDDDWLHQFDKKLDDLISNCSTGELS